MDGEDDEDDGSIIEKQSVVPTQDPILQIKQAEVDGSSKPKTEDKPKEVAPTEEPTKSPPASKPPLNPAAAHASPGHTATKASEDLQKQGVQRVATNPRWIGPSEDEVPVLPGVKGPKKRLTQVPRHGGTDGP